MSKNAETAVLQENEMGTLPVGKLLRKMSLPLIFSMFVQVLYGLVDSMYVARLGDTALTAISLCMPVQYLVLGVGIGIGVGVNSILSKKLGEKDEQGVNRVSGFRPRNPQMRKTVLSYQPDRTSFRGRAAADRRTF